MLCIGGWLAWGLHSWVQCPWIIDTHSPTTHLKLDVSAGPVIFEGVRFPQWTSVDVYSVTFTASFRSKQQNNNNNQHNDLYAMLSSCLYRFRFTCKDTCGRDLLYDDWGNITQLTHRHHRTNVPVPEPCHLDWGTDAPEYATSSLCTLNLVPQNASSACVDYIRTKVAVAWALTIEPQWHWKNWFPRELRVVLDQVWCFFDPFPTTHHHAPTS